MRAWGFIIESTRNGYRLKGDDGLLAGDFSIPGRLFLHDEVDSTMNEAHRQALDGAPSGSLVLALRQTQGRSQSGLRWPSPTGGLYCSVILRGRLPLRAAGTLNLETARIIRAALRHNPELRYQWPSSLWQDANKLAGWLIETHGSLGYPDYYVLGVGVNLGAWSPDRPFRTGLARQLASELHGWISTYPDNLPAGQASWRNLEAIAVVPSAGSTRSISNDRPLAFDRDGQVLAGQDPPLGLTDWLADLPAGG